MKKYKKYIVGLFFLSLIVFPFFTFGVPNPMGFDNIPDFLHAIVSFIRNIALAVAPIIFIIGGIMYYFSGGNPEKAQQATNLMKWALVGLVIILIANGITAVIRDVMGAND